MFLLFNVKLSGRSHTLYTLCSTHIMSDNEAPSDSPQGGQTPLTPPTRVYAWRERSWCRPRGRDGRSRSRRQRRAPKRRERSASFPKSPCSAHQDESLQQVQETAPPGPGNGELSPSRTPRASLPFRSDVMGSICPICRCVWMSGTELADLEDRVDALMAVTYLQQRGLAEPWSQDMSWSGAWSGGEPWQ